MSRIQRGSNGEVLLNGEFIGRIVKKQILVRYGPKFSRSYRVEERLVYQIAGYVAEHTAHNEREALSEIILAYALHSTAAEVGP